MLVKWRDMGDTARPARILEAVLRDTNFEESLGNSHSMETLSRLQNIEELRHAIDDYSEANPGANLSEYLEMVTLTTSVDEMKEGDDVVSLMSLHSAKGLEFSTVFITGLEEGIFPSPRAIELPHGFEEERRLFYVGVTRARDRLFLSRADSRSLYGRVQYNPPSTFLLEVPTGLTQPLSTARLNWDRGHRERARSSMMADREPALAFTEKPAHVTPEETELLPFPPRQPHPSSSARRRRSDRRQRHRRNSQTLHPLRRRIGTRSTRTIRRPRTRQRIAVLKCRTSSALTATRPSPMTFIPTR